MKSVHIGVKLTKVHLMPTLSAAWKAKVKFLLWKEKKKSHTHTHTQTMANNSNGGL